MWLYLEKSGNILKRILNFILCYKLRGGRVTNYPPIMCDYLALHVSSIRRLSSVFKQNSKGLCYYEQADAERIPFSSYLQVCKPNSEVNTPANITHRDSPPLRVARLIKKHGFPNPSTLTKLQCWRDGHTRQVITLYKGGSIRYLPQEVRHSGTLVCPTIWDGALA